jgi:hypothetical protein
MYRSIGRNGVSKYGGRSKRKAGPADAVFNKSDEFYPEDLEETKNARLKARRIFQQ